MKNLGIIQICIKEFGTLGNLTFKPNSSLPEAHVWISLDRPFLIDGKLFVIKLEPCVQENAITFERFDNQ